MDKFKNTKKIIFDNFSKNINFYNNDKYLGLSVKKSELCSITKFLKDSENLFFDQLIDITAIDYPSRELRFDIIYILISLINSLKSEDLTEYTKYIADRRLERIGLKTQYGASNPFPWMSETIDLGKEKNFFETRVIEYQTGGALTWD